MSRQSKAAKNAARAKTITAMHKQGEKGPSKTAPAHGKRYGYRDNPEVQKRLTEAAKAAAEEGSGEKTSGKKILRKAGKASEDTPSQRAE